MYAAARRLTSPRLETLLFLGGPATLSPPSPVVDGPVDQRIKLRRVVIVVHVLVRSVTIAPNGRPSDRIRWLWLCRAVHQFLSPDSHVLRRSVDRLSVASTPQAIRLS